MGKIWQGHKVESRKVQALIHKFQYASLKADVSFSFNSFIFCQILILCFMLILMFYVFYFVIGLVCGVILKSIPIEVFIFLFFQKFLYIFFYLALLYFFYYIYFTEFDTTFLQIYLSVHQKPTLIFLPLRKNIYQRNIPSAYVPYLAQSLYASASKLRNSLYNTSALEEKSNSCWFVTNMCLYCIFY